MKKNTKWIATSCAVAGGLILTSSPLHAQFTTNVISNFQNFNLSATYANWDQTGSQILSGGTGYTPTITSGSTPGSYEINAEGYGSGAYNFATPINELGATEVLLTFTLNSNMSITPGVNDFLGPNFDLSDGTHQVQYAEYAHYPGTGTYTVVANLGSIDPTDITAFNLEMDPAGYGYSTPYDITYDSLALLTPAATPEPTTITLAAIGLAGLVIARRRPKMN
jgi:hypothetical protein